MIVNSKLFFYEAVLSYNFEDIKKSDFNLKTRTLVSLLDRNVLDSEKYFRKTVHIDKETGKTINEMPNILTIELQKIRELIDEQKIDLKKDIERNLFWGIFFNCEKYEEFEILKKLDRDFEKIINKQQMFCKSKSIQPKEKIEVKKVKTEDYYNVVKLGRVYLKARARGRVEGSFESLLDMQETLLEQGLLSDEEVKYYKLLLKNSEMNDNC